MKYHLCLLFAGLLTACNNNEQRADRNQAPDTAKSANEISEKARINDSPDFITKEESVIIGPILFGMNEENYRLAEDSFQRRTQIKIGHGSEYDHVLEDWRFHNGHHLYWKDEKVYGMVLEGMTISSKDYRIQARTNVNQLVAAISKKYGEPNVHDDIPEQDKIDVNDDFNFATWNIGKKRIVAAIHNSGSTYYTLLNIYQPEMYPH